MKKKSLGKKLSGCTPKRSKTWKQLYNQAYALWKECCFARDGRVCQVWRYYPTLPIMHEEILQVDHCFQRRDTNLHLDVRNGTVVCMTCNGMKNWDRRGVALAIYEIVQRREKDFSEMRRIHEEGKPNINWKKRWWMEEQIERLKKELEIIKEINEKTLK